jgi:hypothetical protein
MKFSAGILLNTAIIIAVKVILVMDNLNTHSIASLYKAFAPVEARRIARKLEIHYTPKHGSWLDIAEIGINIFTRECLDRRISSIELYERKWLHGTNRTIANPHRLIGSSLHQMPGPS